MLYALMTTDAWIDTLTGDVLRVIFEYALCLAIILFSILGLAFVNRRTKLEMRSETVKKSCLKAKEYAQEMLLEKKQKGPMVLLMSTKLSHLSSEVSDAAWYAYQIVSGKKDIIYEGIAGELDTLATEIANASAEGYLPQNEYVLKLQKTIETLDGVLEKLEGMA